MARDRALIWFKLRGGDEREQQDYEHPHDDEYTPPPSDANRWEAPDLVNEPITAR